MEKRQQGLEEPNLHFSPWPELGAIDLGTTCHWMVGGCLRG